MTWVKLDDGFARHRKTAGLSDKSFRLHVSALCECAAQLTDGRVDKGMLAGLPNVARGKTLQKAISELVDVGLWVEDGSGFLIHDFLEFNQSSENVRANRVAARERMRSARGANNTRCSREQSAKFQDRSPYPVPVPVPVPDPSGSKEPPPPTPNGGGCPLSDDDLENLRVSMLGGEVSLEVLRSFVAGEVVSSSNKAPAYIRTRVVNKLRNADTRRELVAWTRQGDDFVVPPESALLTIGGLSPALAGLREV